MEKNEEKGLERNLEQKHFEEAARAIKGGKKDGSLTNVELVENLVESYKGKTVQAPVEVIITSALFLNAGELMGTIKALKHTLYIKMAKELGEKADKGEITVEDTMAALMLTTILKKESKED
jgi:hypothetical protein|nr:MAG TPA: hypothetical protein [Crassvirales sp.]